MQHRIAKRRGAVDENRHPNVTRFMGKSSENLKAVMACKTITELTEAQNKFAQQSFEDMMQCATRLSELSIKICTEAFEPINDQLAKSIKKASESMAA